MKKKLCIGLLLLGCCMLMVSMDCFSSQQTKSSKQKGYEALLKRGDLDIHFYGKVIDQFGDPVEGAKVIVSTKNIRDQLSYGATYVYPVTDKDGVFKVEAKAREIYVSKIEKGGYEFPYALNKKRGMDYLLKQPDNTFVANSDDPFVFHLRKLGHPAYLTKIGKKITCNRGEDVETSFGVAKDWITSEGKPKSRYSSGRHKDIKVSVSTARDGKSYEATFSSLDKDSGMILSDELLYEAPKEGYTPEVKVSLNTSDNAGETTRYIYVEARAGEMYSRLKVKFDLGRRSGLQIHISGLTNPDGSRNLEYDEEFQFQEEKWRKEIDERRDREKDKAKNEKRKFDEEAFMKKIHKEKAERDEKEKKENPKWWHKLEDKAKDKD